jgi:hypothetical protein
MEKNAALYTAAAYCLAAAKALNFTEEEEQRIQLLSMSEDFLSKIQIDENEIQRIGEYADKIKAKIKG